MKNKIRIISLILIPLILLSTTAAVTYAADTQTNIIKAQNITKLGKGGAAVGANATLSSDSPNVALSLKGKNTAYVRITPGGSYPSEFGIQSGILKNSDYQSVTLKFNYWDGDTAVYTVKGISVGQAKLYFGIYDSATGDDTILAETTVTVDIYNATLSASPKTVTVNMSAGNSAQLKVTPYGYYPNYFGISRINYNSNIVDVTFKKWSGDTAVYNVKGLKKGTANLYFEVYENETGEEVILANTSVTVKVIKQKSQTIKCKKSFTKVYGANAFSLKAKAKTKLSYSSSDKKVAKVSSSGKVTVAGCGKAVITIKAKSSSSYKAAKKKVTVLVKPGKVTITKKSIKNGFFKMNFKKQKNCSGYKLQVSTKKNYASRYTASATLAGNAKGAKIKVSSGTYYYVRIRAYKKIGSKTYYGAWRKTSIFA